MTGFEDIQDLLSDILDDKKPLPVGNPTAQAHKAGKKGKQAMPPEAVEAVTQIAVETFDPELLEIAAQETALSQRQVGKARRAITQKAEERLQTAAEKPACVPIPDRVFRELHEAMAVADKVTQGVTDEEEIDGALAEVKGAIFADTLDRQREEEVEALRIPMPSFTGDDLSETMDIRNFATLVTLNTARWHAKVKDRKTSSAAAIAAGAIDEAFETRKRLLAGADEKLNAIHKAIDAARAKHYEMTLPWTTCGVNDRGRRTGPRLLPNTLFFEYAKEMSEYKSNMQAALNAFVPEYPAMIEVARKNLGKRFDISEYPNADSIKLHFDLSFDFKPIPKGDDFQGLPKQQLDALANTINRKSEQMMENAMQDVWTRLYKAVTHMYERLASPDKTFHYTMSDNVREVTRLLKHLNVTSNTDIERIRKYLDKFICPHDAKDLRDNSVLRQQVAAHVQNVIDKMKKIGGAV
jgi:hypothetical protein